MTKGTLAITAALLLAASAAVLLYQQHPMPPPIDPLADKKPLPPRYGWKTAHSESFALSTTSTMRWDNLPGDQLRFDVRSEVPVSFGVIPKRIVDQQNLKIVEFDFAKTACSAVAVFEIQRGCMIDRKEAQTFVLSDARTFPELVMQGLATVAGSGRAAETLSSGRVTVTISAWECIANCP